jgi:hypothetical protein
MPIKNFEPSRAVEIRANRYGTGYRIGGRLILTAAHLVDQTGSICSVRSKDTFGDVEGTVVWKGQTADIALVELPEKVDPCAESVVLGKLPAQRTGEKISFQMYGYPKWGGTVRREDLRAPGGRHVEGTIYLADTSPDGLLVIEPERLPSESISSSTSEWSGASGSAIICGGLVIGVQSCHQNPNRSASLEASPLTQIGDDVHWFKLMETHGVCPKLELVQVLDAYNNLLEANEMQDSYNEEKRSICPKIIEILSKTKLDSFNIFPNISKNFMNTDYNAFVDYGIQLTNEFIKSFENGKVTFTHRNQENISLNDLFVFPELRVAKKNAEDLKSRIRADKLWCQSKYILILGSEQSGKTSLAKKIFLDAPKQKILPLYIEGQNIKSSRIEEKLPSLFQSIYVPIDSNNLNQLNDTICIVDDLDLIELNHGSTIKFLENLNSLFDRVILFANESYSFRVPELKPLDEYEKFEILPFKNSLRSELIDKWVNLGTTENTLDNDVWASKDNLSRHVHALVRKSGVPAKPFYLLMILQTFEMSAPQQLELTAYGHYYQFLIYQSLERVKVRPDETDTYINILSELSEAILNSPNECLSKDR